MNFSHFISKSAVVGLAASALLVSACGLKSGFQVDNSAGREGIDPSVASLASSSIERSFKVAPAMIGPGGPDENSKLGVDHGHLMISKTALGKEFLLSTNLLSQVPTPMFSSQQSRVVSFVQRDQKVYLLDVTKNNIVGGDSNIAQNLLIAEMPILNEGTAYLTVDFNAGMKQIFTVGDMASSDDPEFKGATYKLPAAQVRMSYLDEIKIQNNALLIRQVAQLEVKAEAGVEAQPVEVRYQIKPYLPDAGFVPVKSPGFDKVGYFEANPLLLKDGSTRVYAMKWNEKKKIQFAVSANTPVKYQELLKNALLYWNKILGDGAIEVIQLTDRSLTAPQFDMNIIQWADWDSAGYAFADAHVDPRSGEVTSAQIFFPSAFVEANVAKRVRLTRGSRPVIGLQGFRSSRLCQRDLFKEVSLRQEALVSPEAMDKAMRDYVYEVVAHEMGHVMGLRHNFAGNLAANYDFKDRKELILNYYNNMKAPAGIVDSSSVMEYSRFEESAWNGDQFQNGGKALAYDEMAISYLYLGKPLPETQRPFFCTDSHIGTYVDCNMSDAGRSIVSSSTGMYQFNLDSLAARLMNLYISKSKLADDNGLELIPVSQVDLNAKALVKTLGVDFAKFMSLMKVKSKFIAVRSPLLPVLSPTSELVEAQEKEYLAAEVARLGGLDKLTRALPADFDAALVAKFSALLEDPLYNSGTLPDGKTYSFSDEEKQVMKMQVALFASQAQKGFVMNEISALSGTEFNFESTYGQSEANDKLPWADSSVTDELSQILLKRFDLYALSKAESKVASEIVFKDGTKKQVDLPVYKFTQDIRLAAAGLLMNDHAAIDWGVLQQQVQSDEMDQEMELVGSEDKIDLLSINRPTLKWILNNKQIQSALQK